MQDIPNSDRCRLYLITPPGIADPDRFAEHFRTALDGGDVACVQLRLKADDGITTADDDTIRRAAKALMPIAHERDIAFLLNDNPRLAAELGCDGVHIGDDDEPYARARDLVGPGAMVGVTCHESRHAALIAAEKGADYVAFGAFYETTTKNPKSTATPDILTWWSAVTTVPCVAIGGITEKNCAPLVRAGADFLAVMSGVWNHPGGPAQGVKAINRAIAEA